LLISILRVPGISVTIVTKSISHVHLTDEEEWLVDLESELLVETGSLINYGVAVNNLPVLSSGSVLPGNSNIGCFRIFSKNRED
jgi:hypothetical protein